MTELTLFQPNDGFSRFEKNGRNLPDKYGKRIVELTNLAIKITDERSEIHSYALFKVLTRVNETGRAMEIFANSMTPAQKECIDALTYNYMIDTAHHVARVNAELERVFLRAAAQPDEEGFFKELGRLFERYLGD